MADRWQAQTGKGQKIEVQIIVAGIGIVPNVSLAQEAGLKVSDGVEVDEYLRTTDARIYAAGDVARFHEVTLGIRPAGTLGQRHQAGETRREKYGGGE